MNPENNQQPEQPVINQTSTVENAPVVDQTQTPMPKKKSPVEMITSLFSGLKEKVAKKPAPDPGAPMATEMPPKSKIKIPKKLILILVILIVLLIALAIVMTVMRQNGGGLLPSATPSPTPSPTPVVEVPSQYADDEDVAEIQKQMEELDKLLNESSFRDETLRVPTLDWDVSFE